MRKRAGGVRGQQAGDGQGRRCRRAGDSPAAAQPAAVRRGVQAARSKRARRARTRARSARRSQPRDKARGRRPRASKAVTAQDALEPQPRDAYASASRTARSRSPSLNGFASQRQPLSSRNCSASVPATSPVTKITRFASAGASRSQRAIERLAVEPRHLQIADRPDRTPAR